jgi:hypothetical protein
MKNNNEMIVEKIAIQGFDDPNKQQKPSVSQNGKLTIEEKTDILQQLQRLDMPDALRKVLLERLQNG